MQPRTIDDQRYGDLLRAAQSGDADAYLTLLQEIAPRVRQMLQHQLRAAGTADLEDLVQDVLLSLHTARATYDARRPFLPWLAAIVRRRAVDGARRWGRRAAHEVQVDDLDVTFGHTVANSISEPPRDAGALRRAVRSLPDKQREAIELLKLQGLSLKEAAAVSGMSVGALKVATHRAVAALRRMLVE